MVAEKKKESILHHLTKQKEEIQMLKKTKYEYDNFNCTKYSSNLHRHKYRFLLGLLKTESMPTIARMTSDVLWKRIGKIIPN